MSILQYYSRTSDFRMPNPRGLLSRSVPRSAISAANKEVQDMLAKKSQPRGSYRTYTAKQRAEIGKWALENGVQSARRKFSGKALKSEINESTVRLFRNQYRRELEKRRHGDESEDATAPVCELPQKKRGRPLLLGKRLDSMEVYCRYERSWRVYKYCCCYRRS